MKKIALAAAMSVASFGAFAQAYLAVGAGASRASIACVNTVKCKTTDSGFKVYGGYKLTPNVALEVGYIDFGKANFDFGTYNDSGFLVRGSSTAEVNAFTAAVAGRLAFGSGFEGVARLGVAHVKTSIRLTRTLFEFKYTQVDDSDETKFKPYLGMGLEYAFTKSLKGVLSADFSRSEIDGDTADVRLVGVGLHADF